MDVNGCVWLSVAETNRGNGILGTMVMHQQLDFSNRIDWTSEVWEDFRPVVIFCMGSQDEMAAQLILIR